MKEINERADYILSRKSILMIPKVLCSKYTKPYAEKDNAEGKK